MSKRAAPEQDGRKKGGRPSGLNKLDFDKVEAFASLGHTDIEIADLLDVSPRTVAYWKKTPRFLQSLKKGKLKADLQVTKSLYENALGGDTTAQIFWLKNRRPDRWRDKRDFEHSGRVDSVLTFEFGESAPEAGPRAAEEQEEDGE